MACVKKKLLLLQLLVLGTAAAAASAVNFPPPPPSAATPAAFRLRPRPRLNATQSRRRPKRQVIAAAAARNAASYGGRVFAHQGLYFTSSTSIGSPPVAWTAAIDTGSDLIWRHQCSTASFPSSSFFALRCSSPECLHLQDDLELETCSSNNTSSAIDFCSYQYPYAGVEFSKGVLATDTLTLLDHTGSTVKIPSLLFGCDQRNITTRYFGGVGDGIMGLSRGPLSLTSQLGITAFSYCLQPLAAPQSKTTPLIFFAGAAHASSSSSSVWPHQIGINMSFSSTPLLQNTSDSSYYFVSLEGIAVGDIEAIIPPHAFDDGVIFDSGTPLTVLATDAYRPVVKMLAAGIAEQPVQVVYPEYGFALELCYAAMPTNVPALKFRFGGGAEMDLPLQNYIVDLADFGEQKSMFCVSLRESSGDDDDMSIIGNIQQQNYYIVYDTGANTLSFAPASCDTI